jgi:hypothetical protein
MVITGMMILMSTEAGSENNTTWITRINSIQTTSV